MSNAYSSIKTNYKQINDLGSAKSGFKEWFMQRVSAAFLVPLLFVMTYFGYLVKLNGLLYINTILQNNLYTSLIVSFFILVFYHASIGMKVIIEDYVPSAGTRLFLLYFVYFSSFVTLITLIITILSSK
jgi:succinate dehydrogenase / fumarate reductase membrane anchor subunit